jgi:hypothetical protein
MLLMTRTITLLLLVCAACKTVPTKIPDEEFTSVPHAEYARFRPVAIVVLKSDARVVALRSQTRKELYSQLIDKLKYSPIRLSVVDTHTDSAGKFAVGTDLDIDATVHLNVTEWKRIKGQHAMRCDATLVMVHQTGVELYRSTLKYGAIPVKDEGDYSIDIEAVSKLIVAKMISQLPERPPLPE